MSTEIQAPQQSAWRSPWVLGWIGLVVVVLCINLVMVYLAFATNPGLVAADYYARGQDYEQTLVSRRARDPLWVLESDIPAPIRVGNAERLRLFVVDRAGQPVDPESATFYAYRPSDASRDFSLPMQREDRGRYVVEASFPLAGVWDTLIAVRSGADEHSISARLTVSDR